MNRILPLDQPPLLHAEGRGSSRRAERRDLARRSLCGAVAAWFHVHPSALAALDRETVSTMAARLRAAKPAGGGQEIGAFRLDHGARTVHVEGRRVDLAAADFDLLGVLLASPARVHTHRELLQRVWGDDVEHDPGTLRVHIRRLRATLAEHAAVPFRITTVRGRGYRIDITGIAHKKGLPDR